MKREFELNKDDFERIVSFFKDAYKKENLELVNSNLLKLHSTLVMPYEFKAVKPMSFRFPMQLVIEKKETSSHLTFYLNLSKLYLFILFLILLTVVFALVTNAGVLVIGLCLYPVIFYKVYKKLNEEIQKAANKLRKK